MTSREVWETVFCKLFETKGAYDAAKEATLAATEFEEFCRKAPLQDKRPTDAVIALLKDKGPMMTNEIINELSPLINTSATNPRKIISSVISGLRKQGKIVGKNRMYSLTKPTEAA